MNRELEFLKEHVDDFLKAIEKVEAWIQTLNEDHEEIKERLDNLEAFIIPY